MGQNRQNIELMSRDGIINCNVECCWFIFTEIKIFFTENIIDKDKN